MPELFDFETMPLLVTKRLTLREVRPHDDLAALHELFADPEVARFTDTGPFTTMAEAVDVMAWITEIFNERRGMRWAITSRTSPDALIGTCGYNRWDRSSNSADIGYDLMRRFWGDGLMTEALQAIIEFGFQQMGLNRIEADVTVGNDRSARLLEKLGFCEEGLLRQRGHWKGRYHDLHVYGLLRDDWNA